MIASMRYPGTIVMHAQSVKRANAMWQNTAHPRAASYIAHCVITCLRRRL